MGLFREEMAAILLTYRRLGGTQKPVQHLETWASEPFHWMCGLLEYSRVKGQAECFPSGLCPPLVGSAPWEASCSVKGSLPPSDLSRKRWCG